MSELPARSRGVIALLEANCTVCMLCVRECPDWCIHIESHTETVEQHGSANGTPPDGGPPQGPARAGRTRPRLRNALDRFAIDYGQCMYCGICIEVCPFDALHWAPEFGYPGTGSPSGDNAVAELVHERDRLSGWVAHVPPPPAVDIEGTHQGGTGGAAPSSRNE